MQGVQRQWGERLLPVILVDIDRAYGTPDAEFLPKAARILAEHGRTWPNTVADAGWETTKRRLNLDGYTKVLVDAAGIVRGVDFHADEFERAVATVMQEWAKARRAER